MTIDKDTVRIGSLELALANDQPDTVWNTRQKDALLLLKPASFLNVMDRFFTTNKVKANAIFELGILDGGSTAFWFEYFQPGKMVAIDRLDREDHPQFRAWITRNGLSGRLKTFWRTDQADRDRLAAIVNDEFNVPLDLVIDDASHELHATKASFETLFPQLRPGGIYVIEDWGWETNPCYREPDHPWVRRAGLVEFIQDLVVDTVKGTVRQLTVCSGFAAIERA